MSVCVCVQGLESLDSARQLYQRGEFAALRLSFLQTLFKTLLRRSHTLLQDEIIVTIHSIVSVVRHSAFCLAVSLSAPLSAPLPAGLFQHCSGPNLTVQIASFHFAAGF